MWEFKPGLKDGEAVPVLISVKQAFTMGKKRRESSPCPISR
jgi:hypothetical protein